jgi:hypothetical protein
LYNRKLRAYHRLHAGGEQHGELLGQQRLHDG